LEGHHGVAATVKNLIAAGHSWPKMRGDVSNFIRACAVCQKTAELPTFQTGAPFRVSEMKPNDKVVMDTVGPLDKDEHGFEYVIIFVDAMTRFVELAPIRDKTATTAAGEFLKYICRYGSPKTIGSDKGAQFVNSILVELYDIANIGQVLSIAYSHQDNSIAERNIREMRKHLNRLLQENNVVHTSWSICVPLVQRIMNAQENGTTGFAPATLRYGYYNALDNPLFPATQGVKTHQEWVSKISDLQSRLVTKHEALCKALDTSKQALKTKLNQVTFTPGSWVLVDSQIRNKSNPTFTKRSGPYMVREHQGRLLQLWNPLRPQKLIETYIGRCRPYYFKEGTDVLAEIYQQQGKYIVEQILSHYFNGPRRIGNLFLQVKYRGYEETYEEQASNDLRKTAAFIEYVNKNPELEKFKLKNVVLPEHQ
jgi:transposase InsO family protein